MDNCVFCQIAAGQIPAIKIFEDSDFIVFMDIAPITEGHCLITPKAHHELLSDMPDELLAKALPLAKKTAGWVMDAVRAPGCNLLQNNGAVAGQAVGHWHLHVIPRKDRAEMPPKIGAPADLTKLPFLAERIRAAMNGGGA